MVETRGRRGRHAAAPPPSPPPPPSQQPPPLLVAPIPTPELTLIMRSLEAIMETLKGPPIVSREGEQPQVGGGKLEGSGGSEKRHPQEDISRELQKIKLPEFSRGRAGERVEAWLEGMTRCFTLKYYASVAKTKTTIFQLRGSALIWWGNMEKQLHLTTNNVPWELFEERFHAKYLPPYYQEQQARAFHALLQGNKTMEEYEMRFMKLVKYVPSLNIDERQAERFVYGLNPRIRALVRMWRLSSVAKAVECALYVEEHLGIKRESWPFGPPQLGFVGKSPRNFFRGGSSRPPPHNGMFTPRG